MNPSFPGRLAVLRTEARLSQNALADILGLAVSTLSRMENGEKLNPTLDTIDRICGFFGVRREWLLDGTKPMLAEQDAEDAGQRFFALVRSKIGTDEERELREQKLLAFISAGLAQVVYNDREEWKLFRAQIIAAIDAHAAFVHEHDAELKQARLKMARAGVGKKGK